MVQKEQLSKRNYQAKTISITSLIVFVIDPAEFESIQNPWISMYSNFIGLKKLKFLIGLSQCFSSLILLQDTNDNHLWHKR